MGKNRFIYVYQNLTIVKTNEITIPNLTIMIISKTCVNPKHPTFELKKMNFDK